MIQQIAALGTVCVKRVSGSGSSLPRKVAWPGHIMHTAATCLSTSPCRQNRRCLPRVFFERILLPMAGVAGLGNKFLALSSFERALPRGYFRRMCMFLHCGGHGVLSSSFLLAWLAEELSRWNKLIILYNCSRRRT